MPTNPLQDLHDIHLPSPVSFWPLAPGWYVLACLLTIIFLLAFYAGWRYWRRKKLKRLALTELQHLETTLAEDAEHLSLTTLSTLLRRSALAAFPRQQVAGLHGEAWLEFLDATITSKNVTSNKNNKNDNKHPATNKATSQSQAFSQGVGRILIYAPYADENKSHQPETIESLLKLVQTWIKRNL